MYFFLIIFLRAQNSHLGKGTTFLTFVNIFGIIF